MILNKKGLTLVELIVVITILGIIIILVASQMSNIQRNLQIGMFCTKVQAIEQAAVQWGQDNRGQIHRIVGGPAGQIGANKNQIIGVVPASSRVTIAQLVTGNYLPADNNAGQVLDPRNDQSMNSAHIYVFIRHNRVHAIFRTGNADTEAHNAFGGPCQP